jgi:beta-ribofuranosylaminobenzene 5'-phosphate synthase
MSLSGPTLVLNAERSNACEIVGGSLTPQTRSSLASKAAQLGPARVVISSEIPRHIGLGSGTALSLGCLLAVSLLHKENLPGRRFLEMSDRAGASGIGYHAFFRGGFIIDGGQSDIGQPILPSSATRPHRPPPLIARYKVPENWQTALFLPAAPKKIYGETERNFFKEHTPTSKSDVTAALAALYSQISIGIIEHDLELLRSGLRAYQGVGFKRLEIANQAAGAGKLLEALSRIEGVACGMSSMGPVVFAIFDSAGDPAIEEEIMRRATEHDCCSLGTFAANDRGVSIR